MDNKDLLLRAIDDYDLYKPQARTVLKTLVLMASDELAIISVQKLSEISKISKEGTYNILKYLEKEKTIECIRMPGSRLNSFLLKSSKLQNIIEYYKKQKQAFDTLNKK